MTKLTVELTPAQINLIETALIAHAGDRAPAFREFFMSKQVLPILDAIKNATRPEL